MRPGAKERAAAFIRKGAAASIAGQHGDNTTHAVACSLVVDFALSDADAAELLREYNRSKCQPPWSDRDLERHLRSARRTANGKPGEVGKALEQDSKDYNGPRLPANNAGSTKPTAAKPVANTPNGGNPPPTGAPRTPRTAFFEVIPFGEGAKARTPRAPRTLLSYSVPISSNSVSPVNQVSKEELSGKSVKPTATSQAKSPTVVPQAKPAAPSMRQAPAVRVDVTTIWNDSGDVIRNGKRIGNLNEGKRNV